MKSLLFLVLLTALTFDAQGREFGEKITEVGPLVVAAIADGEGQSLTLEAPSCVDRGDEPTCVFRFDRDVWFEAVGDSAGLVNFMTFYAAPNDLRKKTGTSFALITAALATFTFEYRGNWQMAGDAAGDLVDAVSKDGYSQVSIDGREFALEADGTLRIFVSEGDECDGCEEGEGAAEGSAGEAAEEVESLSEPQTETVSHAPTKTSEIGPNFTIVVQSKVVVDLCEKSGVAAKSGVSQSIESVFEAARVRGIDPEAVKIDAENMDAYAMALVTLPYMLVDPAERGKGVMMCDQVGQAAELASPLARSEIDGLR